MADEAPPVEPAPHSDDGHVVIVGPWPGSGLPPRVNAEPVQVTLTGGDVIATIKGMLDANRRRIVREGRRRDAALGRAHASRQTRDGLAWHGPARTAARRRPAVYELTALLVFLGFLVSVTAVASAETWAELVQPVPTDPMATREKDRLRVPYKRDSVRRA